MSERIDEGMWAWRQSENHNAMIDLARRGEIPPGDHLDLAFFGGSAFRVTAPSGLTLMIDPWRNPPRGNWDWYHFDFPRETVDVALSTHAHFDHDGLHFVSASTILDRLIGVWEFAGVRVTGIPDKHVSDSTHNAYDWAELTRRLTPIRTAPEDNWRSFDNCVLLVEVGGMRVLHWGDNRPNPPAEVWDRIGEVDVLLLPVDGSEHVLSFDQADAVIARTGARVVVPHHYGIWNVTTRGSTLLPADAWVDRRPDAIRTEAGSLRLSRDFVRAQRGRVVYFADKVAFEPPVGAGPDRLDRRLTP
ncbi:MAG: Zn-dependent hydrolase [Rhodovulum sulfidophilum]|uniref:Zn-dependent hydrolase n=1 Tax=Rhodovulum sulfidophilum TaxID=35806 RepID=A0A2W5N4U2_RHOSU|nr:MAG: Zn-dependent hydrolase [Rhodovulum sulfidophilum]